MTQPSHDQLEAELGALARAIASPEPPSDLAQKVLARLDQPKRRELETLLRRFVRSRRRVVAVIIAALIVALALTPPVRAAVAELFRIGGVVMRSAPTPIAPGQSPDPLPTTGQQVTLEQARTMINFTLGVPEELGRPDRVTVSSDRRVVGMTWGTGASAVHLDQFDGSVSWLFVKESQQTPEWVQIGGEQGAWFPDAHKIIYVDRDGDERTEEARLAGRTLVWQRDAPPDEITLRLEGNLDQDRAVEIAESVR